MAAELLMIKDQELESLSSEKDCGRVHVIRPESAHKYRRNALRFAIKPLTQERRLILKIIRKLRKLCEQRVDTLVTFTMSKRSGSKGHKEPRRFEGI